MAWYGLCRLRAAASASCLKTKQVYALASITEHYFCIIRIHVAISYYLIPSASCSPDAFPFILAGHLLVISTVCRYDASERQPITHPVQISSSPLPGENPSLTSHFTSRDYYLCVG